MKNLLLTEINKFEFIEQPNTSVARDELCCKTVACSICHTDAKMSSVGHRDLILPRVLGHEICIEHPDTKSPYVIWPGRACGDCEQCLNGMSNLCDKMSIIGFHRDGGFSDHLICKEQDLIPIPKGVSPALACFAEPCGCAINALNKLSLSPGQSLLIIGAGSVGLMLAIAAVKRKIDVTVCEIDIDKIKKASIITSKIKVSLVGTNHREKFDSAVPTCSDIDALEYAITSLKPNGKICHFSGVSADKTITNKSLNMIHYSELQILGAYGCTKNNMIEALDLINNFKSVFKELIEDKINLTEVPSVLASVLSGKKFKYIVEY